MEIYLNNQKWSLKGFWPWVPLKEEKIQNGLELMGVTDWIPATVPGGVHYDLYRAGLIENPYVDLKSINCEWVENRWWAYRTVFKRPEEDSRKCELIFKGLGYDALIYVNDIFLGGHVGMYEPVFFDITDILKSNETLELVVLFKNVPDEISQIGKTSMTSTQKSRFNYKWDFSTRMVNIGIWDDVILKLHKNYSIDDIYLRTDVLGSQGVINLDMGIICNRPVCNNAGGLKVSLICRAPDGKVVGEKIVPATEDRLKLSMRIENPELWYPNGYGAQPLYTFDVYLSEENEILDRHSISIGIRKLEYARNCGSPDDALPYTFTINGRKVYIRGVNMTPLDHMYGNVTAAHYERMMDMMRRANVNMVRVWGGGIIEKEKFYELCDLNGIMIWQEFIQSSSGIDNIPSKRPEFLELIKRTAAAALKVKRNHVSLTVWSGGNELMSGPDRPSTYEDENIAMLKALVQELDPQRMFLPTSASGPVEFITTKKGVSHDVHGHWNYLGNPGHYELYRQSDSLFHSEFGVDGVSCLKSLEKFISPEHLKPVSMTEDVVWRHHGEWWDNFSRNRDFFGNIDNITVFSQCSQWIQAEGLRFIIEANRRRQFENSGSIIWQFNEPWPNVSCTCLADYYGEPKMAYYWVRNSYRPVTASLDYSRLDYPTGEIFKAGIYMCCNSASVPVCVQVSVLGLDGRLLTQKEYFSTGKDYEAVCVGELCLDVTPEFGEMYFVRLEVTAGDVRMPENLYIFSTRKEMLYYPALELPYAKLEVAADGGWHTEDRRHESSQLSTISRSYTVRNTGNAAVLHIHMIEASNAYWMDADISFFTLFPGEEATVKVSCTRKAAGGFLMDDQPGTDVRISCPDIRFGCFGRTEYEKAFVE